MIIAVNFPIEAFGKKKPGKKNNIRASTGFFVFYYFVETLFRDVFHSLDIWHKAKSIKKCISKVCIT